MPRIHRGIAGPALALAVALLTALLYAFMPYSGDDYAYLTHWDASSPLASILRFPREVAHHWYHVNGRLANFIAPPLLAAVPRWLLASACGAAMWLMLYMSLKWSGTWRRHAFPATLLIAVVALAFPWWDSMQLFDCQFNYVWTSALVLSALWLITASAGDTAPGSPWKTTGSALVAIAGGMMHESASLPLLVGLAAWWALDMRRRPLPRRTRTLLLCFIFGTVVAATSPGIWHRAAADSEPNDILLWLFLKSDVIVGVLYAVMAAALLTPRGRGAVRAMLASPVLILVVATLPALVISLRSGIVGRSGWFASLYALIALTDLLRRLDIRVRPALSRAAAVALALPVVAHYAGCVVWQHRRYADFLRFEKAYENSSDGVVALDHIRDTQLPRWTLNRTRGIPDPDDVYQLEMFAQSHRRRTPFPVVLPADALTRLPAPGTTTVLQSGDMLADRLPAGAVPHPMRPGRPQLYIYRAADGELWTAQTFMRDDRTLYHLAPLILDPGDRLEGPVFAPLYGDAPAD